MYAHGGDCRCPVAGEDAVGTEVERVPVPMAEAPVSNETCSPGIGYLHPDILSIVIGHLASVTESHASVVGVAGVSREWRMAVQRWAKASVRTVRLPADAQEGHLVLLSRACPMLRQLNMDGAERAATSRTMKWTVKRMKNLEEFTAGHCYHIKDGACEVAKHCLSLRKIDLRYCFSLPRNAVAEIAQACRSLRDIDVSGVDCVAQNDLLSIAANLKDLRSLKMNGCDGVTDEGTRVKVETDSGAAWCRCVWKLVSAPGLRVNASFALFCLQSRLRMVLTSRPFTPALNPVYRHVLCVIAPLPIGRPCPDTRKLRQAGGA